MSRLVRGCLALGIALLTGQSLLAQQGDAKVEVAKAVSRNLPGSYTFVGTVHPARRAVLGSAVDGRLIEIVEDGTYVRKGQPVARMRTGTINIEIEGAKAELALREDEEVEMKAGMREEEVAMAEAKLHSSEALANFAKSRYDRVKTLYAKGQAISQEEVEQALSAFTAAEKNMAAAQAEFDLARKGHRDERKQQAKDRVAMQREAVNQLRDRRNKYWVRAYFDGYIVTQHADVGAWIKQGDPLVELIELDTVEITVNVPEHHIDRVRLGSQAQVRIEAVSAKDAWTGEIISINPQADLRSRTFAVKVRLKNEEVAAKGKGGEKAAAAPTEKEETKDVKDADVEPSDLKDTKEDTHVTDGEMKQYRFKSGMLSHVTMRIGEKQDAILIPKDALVLGGSSVDGQPSYTVYVATPNKMGYSAQIVPVAIGMFDGDWVEVISRVPGALTEGTLVVTLGNERLRPMQGIQFKVPK